MSASTPPSRNLRTEGHFHYQLQCFTLENCSYSSSVNTSATGATPFPRTDVPLRLLVEVSINMQRLLALISRTYVSTVSTDFGDVGDELVFKID